MLCDEICFESILFLNNSLDPNVRNCTCTEEFKIVKVTLSQMTHNKLRKILIRNESCDPVLALVLDSIGSLSECSLEFYFNFNARITFHITQKF
jgi:hypothetical protein